MSMICFAHKIGRLDTAISETFNISSETLGNEGQQPPLPQQGLPGQQPYYGWQYDQDHPGLIGQQQAPVVPSQPDYPSQPPPPIIPQQNQGQDSLLPKQY